MNVHTTIYLSIYTYIYIYMVLKCSMLEQVEKIANNARQLNARLRKAQEMTRLFNSRELLFGAATTDYTQLKHVMDQFAPFLYLWETADAWKLSHQCWMNDPFDTLNAGSIDENVNGWFKGLFKTLRDFQKSGFASQASSCELIRNQVLKN